MFDPEDASHVALVRLAQRAEAVAAQVDVAGVGFQRARRRVREALEEDGVGQELEESVGSLLDTDA
jgi:hypothetical protein